jgi:hypothetical protein
MAEKDDTSPEREEIDLRTEPERVADDKVEALERELAALQPGVQVVIERLKPTWCKGQLEKLTVDEDGLDLDYLIQNWGGQLLSIKIIGAGGRIRGSHSVELYSFDPRRYGKLLRAPNKPDEEETPAPAPNPVVIQSQPAQDPNLLGKLFDMLNAQRSSEVETLRLLLQQQQSAPAPAPAFNGVNELIKMAGAFNKLKDLFQIEQPQSLGNPEDMFPMQIMDMLGKFWDNGKQQPQPRGQLAPPQQQKKQPSQPPGGLPPPSAGKVTPIRQGGEDLITQFSSLPPENAADVLMTALGRMPPEKQQAAFDVMKERFYKFMPEIFDLMDENEAADDEDETETEGVGES